MIINSNIPNVIPQVGYGKDRIYVHLNPILRGGEAVSYRPSAQEKRINRSKEVMSKHKLCMISYINSCRK